MTKPFLYNKAEVSKEPYQEQSIYKLFISDRAVWFCIGIWIAVAAALTFYLI